MTDYRLKHREKLLSDIAYDLKSFSNPRLEDITVKFFADGTQVWKGGLTDALEVISNDLFFNEEGDFSEADVAMVLVDL